MDYHQLDPVTSKKCGVSSLGFCKLIWINHTLRFTIGPHWPFNICIGLIYVIVIVGFSFYISLKLSLIMQIIGTGLISLSLVAYLLTALVNPGIVYNDGKTELKESYCQHCFVNIEPSVKHCDDCQVCVRDLDHHCPLSGKCIAKGNLLAFYAFLASLLVLFVFTMFCGMISSHFK